VDPRTGGSASGVQKEMGLKESEGNEEEREEDGEEEREEDGEEEREEDGEEERR
jgi:hypothetical protein